MTIDMKSINTFIISMAAITCLASCELKRELFGVQTDVETGSLELGVNVKLPASQTRTDSEETTISTDNFALTIEGTGDVSGELYTYDAVTEFAPITLPVGTYTVSAHSPGELLKQMNEPYYQGSSDIAITTGITTVANVECRRANSRIQIAYGEDFLATFTEWTITIDDGSEMVLTFTHKEGEQGTTPIYWHFNENTTIITVNVTAKTVEGNTTLTNSQFAKSMVSESYNESDNFTGGDAVLLNMGITESLTGDVTGITINTDITFEDQEESVELPAVDENQGGGEEPGTGGEEEPGTGDDPSTDEAISITEPEGNSYLTDGVHINNGVFPTSPVTLNMSIKNGIQNLLVKVETDNSTFEDMVGGMGLTAENGLDLAAGGAATGDNNLDELFPLPQQGATKYTFTLSETLMGLLNNFAGTHHFMLTVIDQQSNQVSETLTVTVTTNESAQ